MAIRTLHTSAIHPYEASFTKQCLKIALYHSSLDKNQINDPQCGINSGKMEYHHISVTPARPVTGARANAYANGSKTFIYYQELLLNEI